MNIQTTMSGLRKAAIVALMIGEDASASIFKHLSEDEIETLLSEMAALGRISSKMGEQVLEEFHQTAVAAEHVARGDIEFAKRVLIKSFGPDTARRMIDRVMRAFQSNAGFASLERADPQQLSKFILGEHPQTIALILAHLQPANAAQLATLLPEELRVEVLTRMASLEDISPDVVSRISSVIEVRLKALGGPSREQHGGVRAVAELFNRLERTVSTPVLEAIEEARPELAVSIRNLMFVFDDLLHVDDNGMREIIQRADKKGLTVALKGASDEIRQRFFGNMSKRAGEMLREEMEVLGAVRLRDVEKAQQEVVAIARKLEEEGLISTGAAAGEAYVV
ncbi:MAG TPA: flagellar motor switch protein FliG [Vicinamibacterales bacterium]|nr:flagellar motor switch protein FliG [Vicinamibacterales bacterium]